MSPKLDIINCEDAAAWETWLAANYQQDHGVWLKIAKNNSGVASVTNDEAVDVGLCWGWISGHRKPLDETYFLQRYTRRRPQSNWSAVNVAKVKTLIAAGRVQPPGLAEIDAAKADGRWDVAERRARTARVAAGIRTANMTDLPSLQTVFRRSSLSNEGNREALLAHPDTLDFSDQAVRQGRTRVADDVDGRIVGFITTDLTGGVLEIEDLFVDPEWMRHGVGRALVHDALAIARHHAVARIEVTANPHALDFYKAVGFIVDSIVDTQFQPAPRMRLDTKPEAIESDML